MCATCEDQETSQPLNRLHRRRFLKASATITAMAFAGAGALSDIAHADALTMAQRDKLSPELTMSNIRKDSPVLAEME